MRSAAFFCLTLCAVTTSLDARTARTEAPDPCSLVSDQDAFRLLGWTVGGRSRKHYAVAGATGSLCFIDSPQGKIIVTVPARGVDFIGVTPYSDSGAAGLARHVYGLGGEVELYNGTAYVTRYKRSVSVHVVPNENPASYDDVAGFAKTVLAHLR